MQCIKYQDWWGPNTIDLHSLYVPSTQFLYSNKLIRNKEKDVRGIKESLDTEKEEGREYCGKEEG